MVRSGKSCWSRCSVAAVALFAAAACWIILNPAASQAGKSPWTGKVVGVSDGDTITVMRDGRGVKVRLAEIDTPEKRQPYGQAAKRFTSNLCFGKLVTVKPATIDRYSRVVAHVILADGRHLNEEVVSAGLAWQYKRYSKSVKLAAIEAEAQGAKRGLWSKPNPIPPWEWRKARRGIRAPPAAGGYHGNIKSRKLHRPGCRYYSCKNCTAVFGPRQEAIRVGYAPCGVCKP